VIAGAGLAGLIDSLQDPRKIGHAAQREVAITLERSLKATLRHYQTLGVQWLWLLYSLGLGGCLADDMGLGKTIQVLSLLLLVKERQKIQEKNMPHLLVVPASLLGNWASEIEKFAPELTYRILHGSFLSREALASLPDEPFSGVDLVITTYHSLLKITWLHERTWNSVILDEAQAIKNQDARQTRAVKRLQAKHKLILTGTPIENRLGDLWSLFDFVCPGLLGSSAQFSQFTKSLAKRVPPSYAPLRKLVAPYILRRLKTDKAIIADLPDKTELTAFCSLSKRQAVLYQKAVEELTRQLDTPLEDMKRRGLILAFLLRLKQICNHPSQWLGDGAFVPEESGKFTRLLEICETIAARQEKVLIFTQFREIIPVLHDYLKEIFHRPGLILHGGTPVGERKQRVDTFQQELGPPYFILSLKAGGTGLNLTAASHVIHFDRWWNPAVENQATDRAYRIGQKKNILVHKFVCRGTIEEKIDRMIEEKKGLSNEILEGGSEALLTEMDNKELLRMVRLDIHSASLE
jgi:non-specific serine/threonine protein kinase